MALCAVMGHVVDAIDVDPRNEGHIDVLKEALEGDMPRVYGVQKTPSGGEHYLIATLNVRKVGNVVPGVDIQAGNEDGVGRGILFLAPTVRLNKTTGEEATYTWEVLPDLGPLLIDGDDSGAALATLVEAKHAQTRGKVDAEGSYDGPSYAELSDAERKESDELVEAHSDNWRRLLADAVSWPEGHRDERGRGWEGLAFQCAWAFAKMAACPWMSLDETGADLLYHEVLPLEIADNEQCAGKWDSSIVEKAAGEPVDIPPWVIRGDAVDDFGRPKPVCDITTTAEVARWLDDEIGRGRLSGMFRRKDDLIYTPRIGEEGYIPPDNPYDHDGPAQIKRMNPLQLAKRVDKSYHVIKRQGKNKSVVKEEVFPESVAERSMSLVDELPHLNSLRMVTHTPVVRVDGTVLDQPGFDTASGVLYLPERGLQVDPVPDLPSDDDVASARKMLLETVNDFPFVSDHDRANYLGCLLIPVIRNLVPPPYKMLIIGAPQRGSGKSLLALVMRTLHGGVFRSEIPHDEDERRKVITSVLESTSAPVVQFDNVSGVLRSSVLDGLLTSATWTDRRLGGNVNVEVPNDRLWVVTGNNVHIGGDLERRVMWCTINAKVEHPELRPPDTFIIPNLEDWVRSHRGQLIHAMLTLVRSWAVAGMPTEEAPTSDSFGRLIAVLRGVLDVAGIDGVVGHQSAAPLRSDPDAEELSEFLQAAERVFGTSQWTVKELLDRVSEFDDEAGIRSDELPGDVVSKLRTQPGTAVKSLGRWLSYRKDRVSDGLVIQSQGSAKAALKWHVERTGGTERS